MIEFNNEWTDNDDFNTVVKSFFNDVSKSIEDFVDSFDFSLSLRKNGFRIIFGSIPKKENDAFVCYCFDSDKDNIFIHKGKAEGCNGLDIVINEELNYREGMCTKEFKACIDTYYDKLLRCISE